MLRRSGGDGGGPPTVGRGGGTARGCTVPRLPACRAVVHAQSRPRSRVGWRLARHPWAMFANEAALASLDFGFETSGSRRSVRSRCLANVRSLAVMELSACTRRRGDFDHPKLPRVTAARQSVHRRARRWRAGFYLRDSSDAPRDTMRSLGAAARSISAARISVARPNLHDRPWSASSTDIRPTSTRSPDAMR